jgi:hypothetical protein
MTDPPRRRTGPVGAIVTGWETEEAPSEALRSARRERGIAGDRTRWGESIRCGRATGDRPSAGAWRRLRFWNSSPVGRPPPAAAGKRRGGHEVGLPSGWVRLGPHSAGFLRLPTPLGPFGLARLAWFASSDAASPGFVWTRAAVRLDPAARESVRSAARSVPLGSFAPPGSFRQCARPVLFDAARLGSFGHTRPASFGIPPLVGSFGSALLVRLDSRPGGFARVAAPPGSFGFLSCWVRSERVHVVEPAKELASRCAASPWGQPAIDDALQGTSADHVCTSAVATEGTANGAWPPVTTV